MANVTVLEKGKDENGETFMEVSFTEVDENDEPVGASKIFTLRGDKFYIDGWVATFEDKYIESADELRGASMFVFKSIYGDSEPPAKAQRLDTDSRDGLPGIYKSDEKTALEQKIWSDFWSVCNDTNLQREMGIRTVGGRTAYIEGIEGKTYQVNIRATGSMGLDAIDEP